MAYLCSTCEHWWHKTEQGKEKEGWCHKNAPVLTQTGDRWPISYANGGCGQHSYLDNNDPIKDQLVQIRHAVDVLSDNVNRVAATLLHINKEEEHSSILPRNGWVTRLHAIEDIADFMFSMRISNCLKNMNITTLEHLSTFSAKELRGIKNLGPKSVREIREVLKEKGFSLKGE
ncbi:MAG: DNA-directed RNA polymerase subunit alpha C-terminal domain-containing protein [Chloroflexota bacterium]